MEKMQHSFEVLLKNWQRMQSSDGEDEAEEDANRFEESFYAFIDCFAMWLRTCQPRPATLEDVLSLPEVTRIIDRLPVPLYLNFETEVEYILEGKERLAEDKYD